MKGTFYKMRNELIQKTEKIKFLGIPVGRRIYLPESIKTYLFGIKIQKKIIPLNIVNRSKSAVIPDNTVKIAFKLKGGLGDILIGGNYIYIWKKEMLYDIQGKKLQIDIYAHRNKNLVSALFPHTNNFIDNIYLDADVKDDTSKYDMFVVLNRYPDVRHKNMQKLYNLSPKLIDFVHACEKWRLDNLRVYNHKPVCDGQINIVNEILGKKRIQQADIYNLYNISEKFSYQLDFTPDAIEFFNSLNLSEKKFITIHRGVDDNQSANSTKLWPYEYYNNLIRYIKNTYPKLIIVQIGINKDRCQTFEGVDIDLVGKTTIEDLKILLSKAILHVDIEGGLVHLRHALNGGCSVVLFGPTSIETYGYSENINLRGQGCPFPCEWIINKWQENCAKECQRMPCMISLTPEFVFSKISNKLKELACLI